MGPPGIVQVGQAVTQSWAQVQQHYGGFVGHARETIGRAGGHPFEEGQHTSHLRDCVQRRDEMHLRRAGVGEAHVDSVADEGGEKRVGAVHICCYTLAQLSRIASRRFEASSNPLTNSAMMSATGRISFIRPTI